MAFKEIHIFDQLDDWKEFNVLAPATGFTSQESLESVGSAFSYQGSVDSKLCRNRYIFWRVKGQFLELVEHSLDVNLSENAVRIRFPFHLLPSVGFYERERGNEPCICFFVISLDKTLHRLTFAHPSTKAATNKRYENASVFSGNYGLTDFHLSSSVGLTATPRSLSVLDDTTMFVGCSNGSLFVYYLHPASINARYTSDLVERYVEHQDAGVLSRWWSSLVKPQSNERSIESLWSMRYNSVTYAFALAADKKIRVWNIDTKAIVLTQEVRAELWKSDSTVPAVEAAIPTENGFSNPDIIPVSLRVVKPKSSASRFTVVVFLTTVMGTESQFQFYKGRFNQEGEIELTFERVNYANFKATLVDYQLASDSLWTLWKNTIEEFSQIPHNNPSDYSVRRATITSVGPSDATEISDWLEVILDSHSKLLSPYAMVENIPLANDVNQQEHFFRKAVLDSRIFSLDIQYRALQAFRGDLSPASVHTTNLSESSLHKEIVQDIQQKTAAEAMLSASTDHALSTSIAEDANVVKLAYNLWKNFTRHLVRLWRQECAPIGIFADDKSNFVTVVNGSSLTFLRFCEELETLHHVLSQYKSDTVGEAEYLQKHISLISELVLRKQHDLLFLLDSAVLISRTLGASTLRLFEDDLLHLADPSDVTFPYIANLLSISDAEEADEMSVNDNNTRRPGSQFIIDFEKKISSIKDLKHSLDMVLNYLEKGDFVWADPLVTATVPCKEWAVGLLQSDLASQITSEAFKQVTKYRFDIIRDITFLLFVLSRRSQSLGKTLNVSGEEIRSELIPRCVQLLKSYFILYWISGQLLTSPADAEGTSTGIDAQLSSMTLELSTRPLKRQQYNVIESYYHHLIKEIQTAVFSNTPTTSEVISGTNPKLNVWSLINNAVNHFALQLNCGQQFTEAFRARDKISGIVSLCAYLTKVGQFWTLEEAVRLVTNGFAIQVTKHDPEGIPSDLHDNMEEEASPDSIREQDYRDIIEACLFYLLGQAHISRGLFAQAREAFFKAGSGLAQGSDFLRRTLIRWTGEISPLSLPIAPQLLPADFVAQYYTQVMQLFEGCKEHQFTIEFAFSALAALSVSKQVDSNSQAVPTLWSVIFKHSLSLKNYQQAYIAIISNTDHTKRLDCLRRFVIVLCENSELKLLCETPFVKMLDDVINTLVEKAQYSDISRAINYYHILYAFHVYKSNYRQAAQAMFDYACRIGFECNRDTEALQRQCDSLATCINTLRLVDSKFRWLRSHYTVANQASPYANMPPSPKRKRDDQNDDSFALLAESTKPLTSDKMSSITRSDSFKTDAKIVELADIERMYLLHLATFKILKTSKKAVVSAPVISAADTVALLCEHNLFDDAFSLAKTHSIPYNTIFEILTKKCLQSLTSQRLFSRASAPTLSAEDLHSYWKTLQEALEKYDNASTNYQYHQQVAERIFSTDVRIQLPPWFVDSYRVFDTCDSSNNIQKKHASGLLRLYMKYTLLEEALHLVSYLLENPKLQKTACASWLPYTLIDNLFAMVKQTTSDPQIEGVVKSQLMNLQTEVQTKLNEYFQQFNPQ